MKVKEQGVGVVQLNPQRDFVTKGGEKSIYRLGNKTYAIYHDRKDVIPAGKVAELSVLTDEHVIIPEHSLLDSKDRIIGYSMPFVDNAIPLCKLFTKTYRQNNNISQKQIINLVKKLQLLVSYVHSKKILIVDLNELNFLIKDFKNVYAIDTNSYQTPSFPATAIMEQIKDRHNKTFSQETDWFSWGIISFQMIIGIHPYKGNHPEFEGTPVEKLNARMLKNVSILNKKVSTPGSAYPLDNIPKTLRKWYEAVFDKGMRLSPPINYENDIIVITPIKTIINNGSRLVIDELFSFNDEVLNVLFSCGKAIVKTNKNVYINGLKYDLPNSKLCLGSTPTKGIPVAAWIENGMVELYDVLNATHVPCSMSGSSVFTVENRIYVQSNNSIVEMKFFEMPNKIAAATKVVGNVLDLPNATHVFDGCVLQNLMGRWSASLFPESEAGYQLFLDDLSSYTKIFNAKYENKVLVVTGIDSKGKYDRLVFRIDSSYKKYDCRKIEDVGPTDINFTVGEQGVCVLINEDGKLEIFRNKIGEIVSEVPDSVIDKDMKLFHNGANILFAKNEKIFNIKMK